MTRETFVAILNNLGPNATPEEVIAAIDSAQEGCYGDCKEKQHLDYAIVRHFAVLLGFTWVAFPSQLLKSVDS